MIQTNKYIFTLISTTGATCGAGTAHPSRERIPGINIDFIVIFFFRQNKYNVLLCNILPVYLVENVSCFKVF
jgi:hypothetical protein